MPLGNFAHLSECVPVTYRMCAVILPDVRQDESCFCWQGQQHGTVCSSLARAAAAVRWQGTTSGEKPIRSVQLTSAPLEIKNSTILMCPWLDARCRAVRLS